MKVQTTLADGKVILSISGKLTAATAGELATAAEDALAKCTNAVFDFTNLDYLASAGIRVLMASLKHVEAAGGSLVIRNVQPDVMDVFTVTGLDDEFQFE
jgi:anti-sigma B factor antagonist